MGMPTSSPLSFAVVAFLHLPAHAPSPGFQPLDEFRQFFVSEPSLGRYNSGEDVSGFNPLA